MADVPPPPGPDHPTPPTQGKKLVIQQGLDFDLINDAAFKLPEPVKGRSDTTDLTTFTTPGAAPSHLQHRSGEEPVDGYPLIRLLGRGGFGEVWAARAPGGVEVALKLVPLSHEAGQAELRSLEILRRLRHPNILPVFGFWQVNGRLAIAMELAEGTLHDRLAEYRAQNLPGMPREELLRCMVDAARGIDYLAEPRHATSGARIQHRDIKPRNLLLLGGSVKVADFGLARLLEQSLANVSGGLTVLYASPELFQGKMTARSDQYSLAVTYCELRGGRCPFVGDPARIMHGHLTEVPVLDMLPECERPIVQRALAKEPGQRWPSASAFVEALALAT